MFIVLIILFIVDAGLCTTAAFAQSGGGQDGVFLNAAPAWRHSLGGAIVSLPSIQAGTVCMVLDGGNVKNYNFGGRQLWTYYAGGRLSPPITRSREGTSYICRTDGFFIALSRVGRELWRVKMDGAFSYPPVIGWDGRVFVFTRNAAACWTPSGTKLWQVRFPGKISAPPVADRRGGIILSSEGQNGLSRLDYSGKVTAITAGSGVKSILPLEVTDRHTQNDAFLVLYADGSADVLSQSGNPRALLPLGAEPLAARLADGGAFFYAALSNGAFVKCSVADGSRIWAATSHLAERKGINNDEWAVTEDSFGVYCLAKSGASGFAADGRRKWYMLLDNTAALPSLTDDGSLLACGNNWVLASYQMEERETAAAAQVINKQAAAPITTAAPRPSYALANPWTGFWTTAMRDGGREQADFILALVKDALDAGSVGTNERDYISYLMEIAANISNLRLGKAQKYLVTQRLVALDTLGRLGTCELTPFLTEVFSLERDPILKAAAANAIGRIGSDPDRRALTVFAGAVTPLINVEDERITIAVAGAVGSICRYSGPLLSEYGIPILTAITKDGSQRAVDKAREELATLR
jgi:outer membrane protein assembly factor BamB